MITTGSIHARLLAGSADQDKIRAKHDRDPDLPEQPANLDSCTAPTATIRHALRAFASDILEKISLEPVRLQLEQYLDDRLGKNLF